MIALLVVLLSGFLIVFVTFFFWNRLLGAAEQSDIGRRAWRQAMLSAIFATLMFLLMFVLGAWFAISRLKGEGWFPSA